MKLLSLLETSSATADFVEGVRTFLDSGRSNEFVVFSPGSPPVKVRRTLTKLIESFPEESISRVEVRGSSGCEYYRGDLLMHLTEAEDPRRISFHWDCRWKAEQEGWTDYFGFPDQIRAAREFDYDCFRDWNELSTAEAV